MKSREQLIKGEEKAIGKFALGIAASIKLIAASTGKKGGNQCTLVQTSSIVSPPQITIGYLVGNKK